MKKIICSLMFLGIILVITDQAMAQNCKPGNNQVAVFERPEYQGSCAILGIGEYSRETTDKSILNRIPPIMISSIMIGSGARANLCQRPDLSECLTIDKSGSVENFVVSIKVLRDPNAATNGDNNNSAENTGVVILANGTIMGGYKNGRIVNDKAVLADYKTAEEYRVYGLNSKNTPKRVRTNSVFYDVQCRFYTIETGGGIALSSKADWNPTPRESTIINSKDKNYQRIVRKHLQSKGISNPKVNIEQILRVDLEGDGQDEVILYAKNVETEEADMGYTIKKGSYSILIVRKIIDGKVKTISLGSEIYSDDYKAQIWASREREIKAILDLDDDGIMEIVATQSGYENSGTIVYKIKNGKSVAVLETGCGV